MRKVLSSVSVKLFGSPEERHDDKTFQDYWEKFIGQDGKPAPPNKHMPRYIQQTVVEFATNQKVYRGTLVQKVSSKTNNILVIMYSGSHGSSESFTREMAVRYSEKGCKVLCLDYCGFGASTLRDYTRYNSKDPYGVAHIKLHETSLYEDGLEFYNCGLQILNNDGKHYEPGNVILHAYSLGGPIAAYVTSKAAKCGHKIRGLVLDRVMTGVKQAVKDNGMPSWQGGIARKTQGNMSIFNSLVRLKISYPDIPLLVIIAGQKDVLSLSALKLGLWLKSPVDFKQLRILHLKGFDHWDHIRVVLSVNDSLDALITQNLANWFSVKLGGEGFN